LPIVGQWENEQKIDGAAGGDNYLLVLIKLLIKWKPAELKLKTDQVFGCKSKWDLF